MGELDEAVRLHDERMRRDRQRLIEGYPQPRLARVHLRGAQLLPSRYELLDELPKNGVVCEIGVANGDFSTEILRRCHPAKLHLVDAWASERYRSDRQKVAERFADEINNGTIALHFGLSTERLPEFPDQYFHWVYLDSVHDYRVTSQELAICAKKLKRGGIIAGHDYTPGNLVTPVCYGVVPAVQEFCVRNRWRFLFLTCESHCYASFALTAIEAPE